MKKIKVNGWLKDNQRISQKVLIFISFIFLGLAHSSQAQVLQYQSTPFKDGEVLRYKVKWGFIRLGTVEISQQAIGSLFYPMYQVQLHAKSTTLKVVLCAYSPANSLFLLEEDKETITAYQYDFQKSLILMEARKNGRLIRRSGLSYEGAYYDVLGVIMMMRCLSASSARITLPTIIDFGMKDTDVNFTEKIKEVEVSALDRPVRARQVEGEANWKAWTGVSGPFKGWFSDDEAAIPLKIRLKIFLGSATLELEQVHRPDWDWKYKSSGNIQIIPQEEEKQ